MDNFTEKLIKLYFTLFKRLETIIFELWIHECIWSFSVLKRIILLLQIYFFQIWSLLLSMCEEFSDLLSSPSKLVNESSISGYLINYSSNFSCPLTKKVERINSSSFVKNTSLFRVIKVLSRHICSVQNTVLRLYSKNVRRRQKEPLNTRNMTSFLTNRAETFN